MTARRKPTAMERLDNAVFAWVAAKQGESAEDRRRAYRRAVRALLRERALLAVNEVDGARAAGPWHEQASAMIERIRAAVLGGK